MPVVEEPSLTPSEDGPSTIGSSANGSPPHRESDREELEGYPSNYQAGRGRRVQVTGRGRERFDRAKRATFLEWFAATCNAQLAARQAGVNYRTPYRTRMRDAAFAEAWDLALEQGYARIEAKLLEMQFEQASGEAAEFDGGFVPEVRDAAGPLHHPSPNSISACSQHAGSSAPPPRSGEDFKEVLADPAMAMQLLRQYRGEVMRLRARRAPSPSASPGDAGRLASDAEVRRALVKGLKAFGVRVTAEDLRGDEESPPLRGHSTDPAGSMEPLGPLRPDPSSPKGGEAS